MLRYAVKNIMSMKLRTLLTGGLAAEGTICMLELADVSFSYDRCTRILNRLNYKFERGKVYGITGKTGSGKTTLLRALSGQKKPTAGRIIYEGGAIGFVSQTGALLQRLSIADNIDLAIRLIDRKKTKDFREVVAYMERVGLDGEQAGRKVSELSAGEQKKVETARALAVNPDLILVDEPAGGLDLASLEDMMELFSGLVKRENKCVIFASNSPEAVNYADEVLELNRCSQRKVRWNR